MGRTQSSTSQDSRSGTWEESSSSPCHPDGQAPLWWVNTGWWNGRERERYNNSWARERGGSEEVRMVRNRLAWMTCFPPDSKMMSGYGLLSRAKSWSGAPKQPRRPVLVSVYPVTSETFIVVWVTTYGYVGIWELCCHWGHSDIQTQAKHHACVCDLCCCLVVHDAIKGKKKKKRCPGSMLYL